MAGSYKFEREDSLSLAVKEKSNNDDNQTSNAAVTRAAKLVPLGEVDERGGERNNKNASFNPVCYPAENNMAKKLLNPLR